MKGTTNNAEPNSILGILLNRYNRHLVKHYRWSPLFVLVMLALLAGCSSDDGSKSDSGGETAEQLPSSSSVGADNNQPSSSSVSQNNSSSSNASGSGLCTGFTEGTERQHYGKSKAQICDERDGKKYVYVEIGEQTWLAENLNYEATGSLCYDNDPAKCDKYGRLYDWETAKTACPSGWHLPDIDDWDTELGAATNKQLRASEGWGAYGGDDTYGFALLPTGGFRSGYGATGCSENEHGIGWLWTTTERDNAVLVKEFDGGYLGYSNANKTGDFISVRCVKGDAPSGSSSSQGGASSSSSSSNVTGGTECAAPSKTITLGTQIWAAENLNCEVEGSRCYDDDPNNCDKYGMLYDWETAMKICPAGWHLPSRDEWYEISASIDNSFADVLGGTYTLYDDAFKGIDSHTQWWTATDETNWAYIQRFGSGGISEAGKTDLLSVRCIKDQL